MSQHVQPHVQNLDRSQMQDLYFPPHSQCSISSSNMPSFPLSAPIINNLESRPPSTLVVDITERNMDHITSLEHSLCSNFFCCGAQLADLHALLEHFEENHIVVLAPNGKRVYPRDGLCAVPLDPASGTSTPSSSRASSVTPASPLTPQTPLSPSPSSPSTLLPRFSPPASRKSSFTVAPVYTPFTPSLPIDPADPLLDSSEIVMPQEPAFDFSVHPCFFPPLAPEISSEVSSSSEDEGNNSEASPSHDSTNIAIGFDPERLERPLNVRFISATGGGKRKTDKVLKSSKSRRHTSSGSHSKRREKMYRCPKNGCVKAYLNPNGLKYHLEKGTCKLAEDEDDTSQDRTRRSRTSTPVCAPVTSASRSQNAPSNVIPKIEERSTVKAMIDSQGDDVSQPLSHTAFHDHGDPDSSSGLQAHSYPYPMEVTPGQPFEGEELPSPTLSALPIPLQPTPPLPQSHSVPYTTQLPQQVQFHYPIPTYPTGYIYAPQPRSYFAAELATYEVPDPLSANGTVLPISQ